jgi:hypothetical protein
VLCYGWLRCAVCYVLCVSWLRYMHTIDVKAPLPVCEPLKTIIMICNSEERPEEGPPGTRM